jgi:Tfp pilus assembly protein PilE
MNKRHSINNYKRSAILHDQGFSIIELIIFIVIMGIVGISVLASFNAVLKGTSVPRQQTVAWQVASRCIEWYLEQRYVNSFTTAALTCPSTTVPTFCTVPSGYSISTSVSCTQLYGETGANYKTITVSVTGLGSASLSLLVALY